MFTNTFTFDKSKLGQKIAKDEDSVIYEYRDQGRKKIRYLVKCIRAKDKDKLMQFLGEFGIGSNNTHQCISNYKGVDIQESNEDDYKYMVYIKMKAEEQSLRELIRKRMNIVGEKNYFPLERIISIFYSLASALAYLEDKKIVHNNIMHDSVLFDKNETVKLSGFALSMCKPWKTNERRKFYQSYKPPERIVKLPKKSREYEKKIAFKSDVWCLGKLIVDICLLQDEICYQHRLKEARYKIKTDLEEVERIYNDKTLIHILASLFKTRRRDRPSFRDICEILKEAYNDRFHLIEIRNGEKEESDLNISLSSIQSEDDESQFERLVSEVEQDISFPLALRHLEEAKEEVKEEFKEVARCNQQEVQSTLEAHREQSSQDFKELKTRIQAVLNYKVEEPFILTENINGFPTKATELLGISNAEKLGPPKVKLEDQELNLTYKIMNFSTDRITFKQENPLSSIQQANISGFTLDLEKEILSQELRNPVEGPKQDINLMANLCLNLNPTIMEFESDKLIVALANQEKNGAEKEDYVLNDRGHLINFSLTSGGLNVNSSAKENTNPFSSEGIGPSPTT